MSFGPRWSKPEIEHLNEMAGEIPFPDLVRKFQQRSRQEGWPPRSSSAILQRLHRTHQRGACRGGEWMTTGHVADVLGISRSRVDAWMRRPRVREILQPRWRGKVRYVERIAWRRLARQLPRVLGGFSADALFLLLEDRELADQVAEQHRASIGDWRIRCLETGRIYGSCCEVARQHHISHTAVSRAVRLGRPVASIGMTFEPLRRLKQAA